MKEEKGKEGFVGEGKTAGGGWGRSQGWKRKTFGTSMCN